MFDIPSPADDPRYQQAVAKLGELQEAAAKLRERYERAQRPIKVSVEADAQRILSGAAIATNEAAEAVYRELAAHEAAVQLQKDNLGRLTAEISREICRKVKATHDAKAAKLANALKAAQAADKELAEFTTELERKGVQTVFPVLAFRHARTSDFGSISDWQERYRKYLS